MEDTGTHPPVALDGYESEKTLGVVLRGQGVLGQSVDRPLFPDAGASNQQNGAQTKKTVQAVSDGAGRGGAHPGEQTPFGERRQTFIRLP